jgi:hypothetical protein
MRQAKGRFLEYGLTLTNQKSEQNLAWFDDNLRPYHRAERRLLVFRGHNAGFVAGLALHRVRDGVPGILKNAPVRTIAQKSEAFNGTKYASC